LASACAGGEGASWPEASASENDASNKTEKSVFLNANLLATTFPGCQHDNCVHDGQIPGAHRSVPQNKQARGSRMRLDSQRSGARGTAGGNHGHPRMVIRNRTPAESLLAVQAAKTRSQGTKCKGRIRNGYAVPFHTALIAGRRRARSHWPLAVTSRRMKIKRNRLRRGKRKRRAGQRSGHCDQHQPRDHAPRSPHAF
jgi:hypothetical protein